MSSYLTLIGMLLIVISPVLLPLSVSAGRAVANLFANAEPSVATAGSRRRGRSPLSERRSHTMTGTHSERTAWTTTR